MARLTDKQIELHRTHLGGSSAPVALGFSARMSARHLYHVMRGEMEPPQVDPVMTELGSAFEPAIIDWFERNVSVDGEPAVVIRRRKTYHHRRYPRLICHPDGVLRGVSHILEAKLRGDRRLEDWGPAGTDQVPTDVMIQCRHNMAVMRKTACHVVAFFMSQREYRTYRIDHDPDLARDIVQAERIFLDAVEEGRPPGWDFSHVDTDDVLRRMFPGTDGSAVTLPEAIWHYHQTLEDARERIANLEKLRTAARNVIREEMKTAAIGDLPDGSSYVRARRRRGETTYFALEHRRSVRVHGEDR